MYGFVKFYFKGDDNIDSYNNKKKKGNSVGIDQGISRLQSEIVKKLVGMTWKRYNHRLRTNQPTAP